MSKPSTRLDPLLRLKERDEQAAQLKLAAQSRALKAAQDRLQALVAKSHQDGRHSGSAAEWALDDAAHSAALREVKAAQEAVQAAQQLREAARQACAVAQRTVETFRRATDRERAELIREIERREQKSIEELAALAFHRT